MKYIALFFSFCLFFKAFSQEEASTFSINQQQFAISDSSSAIIFLVGGHIYGYPSTSLFPSSSLLDYKEEILAIRPAFFQSLGDMYRSADPVQWETFQRVFLEGLPFPVFNAVGNHDLRTHDGANIIEKNYGVYQTQVCAHTYFAFSLQRSLFITLDTELAEQSGSIDGEQLHFLTQKTEQAASSAVKYDQVFIFCHQDIWLSSDNNFQKEVLPLLKKLEGEGLEVYLFSGDMKVHPHDLFYKKEGNITYVHTSISDSEQDKILKVKISSEGVIITPISLAGQAVQVIENYTALPSNQKVAKKEWSSRLKEIIFNRSFIWAALMAVCSIALFFIVQGKNRARKSS